MPLSKNMANAYRFIAARQPHWWRHRWRRLTGSFLDWMNRYLIEKAPDFYHKDRIGSDSPGLLIAKNVLHPERFLLKIAYGQLLRLPNIFLLSEKLPPSIERNQEITSRIRLFKSDGFVILPGYFQKQVEGVADRYAATPNKNQPAKELMVRYLSLFDEAFSNIVLHETILSTLGQIFGYQPFIQDLPVITVVDTLHPPSIPSEEEEVTEWHSDNVNTIKMLVFLNDVTESSVRMCIAKGSHKTHRVSLSLADSLYSDEYVRSKYEVVDCVGPKGTVVIFDANALHRQYRVPQSFRAMLAVKYSTGNGFNFSRKYQEGYFELTRAAKLFNGMPLNPIQRCALKGVLGKASHQCRYEGIGAAG